MTLTAIAAALGHANSCKTTRRFAAVGREYTAVDGTALETVKRVAELSSKPIATNKRLSAGARALRVGFARAPNREWRLGRRSHGWLLRRTVESQPTNLMGGVFAICGSGLTPEDRAIRSPHTPRWFGAFPIERTDDLPHAGNVHAVCAR